MPSDPRSVRADGAKIRVSYAIEVIESGFRARFWRVDGSPHVAPSVFTVGDVLHEWRAAQRVLAELIPGSLEWARTLSEIELLRSKHQELLKGAEPPARDARDKPPP